MIYALGYARVSTTKQATQGDSLERQTEEIRAEIAARGWTLFTSNVLAEPFTGTTESRPLYDEALRLIKANPGKIKYFVVKYIDRFSREGALKYQLMKEELRRLGVELRDIGGVIQPSINTLERLGVEYDWSVRSPSAISEVVLAEVASQERSHILTRMIESEIVLTRAGYYLGLSPDGYVTKRVEVGTKRRHVLVPDPVRADFIRIMFTMRAEGHHSDKQIVERINALGYRSRPKRHWNKAKTEIVGRGGERPLTVARLQSIVQMPVYCGILMRKWTNREAVRMPGTEPVLSVALFNAANRGRILLEERNDGTIAVARDPRPLKAMRKRTRFRPDFPYKNVVVCAKCGRPLWASASRGHLGKYFGFYHCSRKHPRYAVPQRKLDAAYTAYLDRLELSPAALTGFDSVLRAAFRDRQSERATIVASLAQKIDDLRAKRDGIVEAFAEATTSAMRSSLEKRAEGLSGEIVALEQEQRVNADTTEEQLSKFLHYARELLERPKIPLSRATNLKEQTALYGLLFDSLPTYDELAFGTPQLSVAYRLSEQSESAENGVVRHSVSNWNQLSAEIAKWQNAYWAIDLVLARMKSEQKEDTSGDSPVAA